MGRVKRWVREEMGEGGGGVRVEWGERGGGMKGMVG